MLFIPTSGTSTPPFLGRATSKGQLYNLDLNRYFNFQFNPEMFEVNREFAYAVLTWNGDATGGDLFYLNSKARTIELPLLYMADPAAPKVDYDTETSLSSPNLRFDFDALEKEIDRWCEKIPQAGRPSRIRIILGPRYFDGVIMSVSCRKTAFFEDLTTREGILTIRFQQWQMQRAS